ncbi:MAG: hypothetical protein ACXWQO_05535, partial [Bdellovibrionota bacterium]
MGTVPQKPILPSMNASVWAALFCLFFSTYSQAAPVASALQQDCSRLYSVMVNQSDPRVLGYQDPDGGLCGPTCLLNPLLVDARRKGLALPAPEELMSQLNSIHHDLT